MKRQRLNLLTEVGFPGDICSTALFDREFNHKTCEFGPWIRIGTRFYKVKQRRLKVWGAAVHCDLDPVTTGSGRWPLPDIQLWTQWFFLGPYTAVRRDNIDCKAMRTGVVEEFEEWFPRALQYQLACTQLAGYAPKHLIFTIWGINDIIRGYFNMTFEDTPIRPPWKETSTSTSS